MFIRWLLHWLSTIWAYLKNEEPETGAVSLKLESTSDTSNLESNKMSKLEIKFTGAGTDTVRAKFHDAAGNETTSHGAVVFTSSDDTIATVTPNDDGISALVTGTGKVGTCTIVATDEKDHASDIATVTTVAGEAVSLDLEEVAATTDSATAAAAPVAAAPAADPAPVAAATESTPAADTVTTAETAATAPTDDAAASTEAAAAPAEAPAADAPVADQSTGTV